MLCVYWYGSGHWLLAVGSWPGVSCESNGNAMPVTLLSLNATNSSEDTVRSAFLFLAVTAVPLSCHIAMAQEANGSVCVAARVDDPFWKEPPMLPNGQINSHGLRVKVDKRPAVAWPDRKSLKIDGLLTSESHVVAVLGPNGKPIESVRFKFPEHKSTTLCLNYDGYQGIGLQEATRRTPWCKCH